MSAQPTSPAPHSSPSLSPAARPAPTASEATSLPWWKAKRARHVGVGALAVAIAGMALWFFAFRPFVSTDDARVAMTFVRLAPAGVSGRIEKVNVVEGARVKTGDVLVEIDHRVPAANLERAKSRAALSSRELGRLQRLTADGSATAQALDQARAADAAAQVELQIAQVALENTYLRSPFDGIVVQKLADVGNLLESNQVAVVVADEAGAWVAANVEETSIGAVKPGQAVRIDVDEGGELEGRVLEVRHSVASQFALIPSDTGAGNYTKVVQRVPIKIAIERRADERTLRAGQSVEVKIRVR